MPLPDGIFLEMKNDLQMSRDVGQSVYGLMKLPYLALLLPIALTGQTLLNPVGGLRILHPHPHLDWKQNIKTPAAAMPETEIQIGTDATFQTIIDQDSVAAVIDRYVPAKELAPGSYHWRVRHIPYGKDPLPWSKPGNFTVIPPKKTFRIRVGASHQEIERTIGWAKQHKNSRILFEKGEWRIYSGSSLFSLKDYHGLIIDGNGATLKLVGFGSFAELKGCTNIIIKGFNIEYLDYSHVAGKIIALDKDKGTVDFQLLPGYPPLEDSPVIADFPDGFLRKGEGLQAKEYNEGSMRLKLGFKNLGDKVYRLRVQNKKVAFKFFEVGDTYVKGPVGKSCMKVSWSHNVSFSDIDMYMCQGDGFHSLKSDKLRILDVDFLRKEGRPIAIHGNVHKHENARLGPWIEGCEIDNSGFDICRIQGKAFPLRKVEGENKIVVGGFPIFRPGETLLFYDKAQGKIISQRKIVEAEPVVKHERMFTVEEPPGEVRASRSNNWMNEGTSVYNLNRQGGQFVWRNNHCMGAQRIGLVCSGFKGLIEKSKFLHTGESSLELRNMDFEGLYTRAYVIRDNYFEHCGQAKATTPHFAIRHKQKAHESVMHNQILLENNEFNAYPNRAMYFQSVRNLVVRGNKILNHHYTKFKGGPGVIEAKNCPGMILEENTIEESRPLPRGPVLVKGM